jgi:hypothetical protein
MPIPRAISRLYSASWCSLEAANDNAPNDPLDYEDFDPSILPLGACFANDATLDLFAIIELLNG